jgi:AraC-like DNA-binding protein
MDTLSDVLRVIRLDGAYFYRVQAAGPWGVKAGEARHLLPQLMPTAEHLIPYHIVTEGTCFGGLIEEELVELAPGDVIVFPHGDAHLMASARGSTALARAQWASVGKFPEVSVLGDGSACQTSFVCGFFGCDLRPFNPLLASLPRRMHIRGMSSSWLGTFTQQVAEESRLGRAGAQTVLTRLAELMFIEVLRRYLDELPAGQSSWLAGLRDEVVGRVLALLHSRPGHDWTLVELARAADTSRTSLAKRFTEIVGQPPMQYLAQWRMQVAANHLVQSGAKISAVGAEVGYESEAAFSRAFKKATGLAPGAWREARRPVQ